MREWSFRRIVWTSALVQTAYTLVVSFVPLPLPASPDSLLVTSGLVGGVLTGVLLSRLPIGDRWSNGANFWDNAVGYGVLAAILGTMAFFVVLIAYNLAVNWHVNRVFAPQVVVTVEFIVFLFHAVTGSIGGGVGGFVGLVFGNALASVTAGRRRV